MKTVRILSLALPLLALGCVSHTKVTLHQPSAPASQRELTLSGDWTYWSGDSGGARCLLAFPLPGARDGPRDFLCYLTLPGRDGEWKVGKNGTGEVGGFLIQAVGELGGKTIVTSGSVRTRPLFLQPQTLVLRLDLSFDDGSRLIGTAWVSESTQELSAFRRRYEGDVTALESPTSQPAEAVQDATMPRRDGTEHRTGG
ncbi:MAG: hypothetical protein U1D55_08205 [Phycisphaerae bacterium]